jgi:hypothetical protein
MSALRKCALALSIVGVVAISSGAASAALLGPLRIAGANSLASKTTVPVAQRQKSAARFHCQGGCPQPPPAPQPPPGSSGPTPGGVGRPR